MKQWQRKLIINMSEYKKHRPNMCKFPFSGVTINPDGNFVLCCYSPGYKIGHISEYKSIRNFFNDRKIGLVRNEFKEGRLPLQCQGSCASNRRSGRPAPIDNEAENLFWSDDDFKKDDHDVYYLEFTPSNACNASCSTCGSKFSSKWIGLDNKAVEQGLKFRNPDGRQGSANRSTGKNYVMSDSDYEKIIEALPTVKRVMMKGGEPLADKRNIKFLEHVKQNKISTTINMITNFSLVDDKMIDLFAGIDNLYISVSIDGVHTQHDWIRSTEFTKIINNIEKYYERTGKTVAVITTFSMYNFFNADECIEMFSRMESVKQINFIRMHNPVYTSPHMIPAHMMKKALERYRECIYIADNPNIKNVDNLLKWESWETTDPERFSNNIEKAIKWIDFLNQERGFKIEDSVPEIYEIRRYYENIRS